jgi:hypothetical protein
MLFKNKRFYSTDSSASNNISKGIYQEQTTIYGRCVIDLEMETFFNNTREIFGQTIQKFSIRTNKTFYNNGGCLLVLIYTFIVLVSCSDFCQYVFKNGKVVQGPSFIFSFLRFSKETAVFSQDEGYFKSQTFTSQRTLINIYLYFKDLDVEKLKLLVKDTILDDLQFTNKQNVKRLQDLSASFLYSSEGEGTVIDEDTIRVNYQNVIDRILSLNSLSNYFPIAEFTIDLTVSNRLNSFVFYNTINSSESFAVSEKTLDNLSEEAFTNIALFLKGMRPLFLYSYDEGYTYEHHYPMLAGFTKINLENFDNRNFALVLVSGRMSMSDVTDLSNKPQKTVENTYGQDPGKERGRGKRAYHTISHVTRDFINCYRYTNEFRLNCSDYVRM